MAAGSAAAASLIAVTAAGGTLPVWLKELILMSFVIAAIVSPICFFVERLIGYMRKKKEERKCSR